jgi:aminoglycoside phosphotransferase (APT) family kinase protein
VAATAATGFPRAPEELGEEWLTDRLRAAGALDPTARVIAARCEPLGDLAGMAGAVVRVRLRCSEPSTRSQPTAGSEPAGGPEPSPGPESLIAKFSTTNEQNLAVMLRYGLYRREVHFYRTLAPRVPIAVPRCYAAEIDAAGRACVLLLEDLGAWTMRDQVLGCGEADAHRCVATLAHLHAAFAGDSAGLAGVWRADGQQADAKITSFPTSWERARQHVGDGMAADLVDAMPRYVAALPQLHAWAAAGPGTLAHGDMRLDNVMFDGDGAVALVDWQNCQRAKGVIDVAYFLTQSVDTDVRRRSERDLLTTYGEVLREQEIECRDEQLWLEYRMAALHAFSTSIVLAGLAGTGPRSAELAHAVIARVGAAVDDLGLLNLLGRVTAGRPPT